MWPTAAGVPRQGHLPGRGGVRKGAYAWQTHFQLEPQSQDTGSISSSSFAIGQRPRTTHPSQLILLLGVKGLS